MKKMISVLLIIGAVFSLCSCKKETTVTVSDSNGKSYTAVQDENGFLKKDEYGKMVVISQDKDGKSVEKSVDFPYYLIHDERIECADFYLPSPEGWKVRGKESIKLTCKETLSEISFTLRSTDTVDECINQVKGLFVKWKPDWKESDETFSFGKVKKLSSENILENAIRSFYIFTVKGNSYIIMTTSYFIEEKNDVEDIEKIIDTICFR